MGMKKKKEKTAQTFVRERIGLLFGESTLALCPESIQCWPSRPVRRYNKFQWIIDSAERERELDVRVDNANIHLMSLHLQLCHGTRCPKAFCPVWLEIWIYVDVHAQPSIVMNSILTPKSTKAHRAHAHTNTSRFVKRIKWQIEQQTTNKLYRRASQVFRCQTSSRIH